jgi:alpha-L-fucosidase
MNHRHVLRGILLLSIFCQGCASKPAAVADKPPEAAMNATPATQPYVLVQSPTTKPVLERNETPEQRNARMAWWHAARFGMFIHWGIYSVPAGTYHGQHVAGIGEWIMNNASIPVAEYASYANDFTASNFDADEWVSIAKNAGMKYIVITSKHHDGFAMFHTKVDGFNVFDATPFHRDPIAELAAACQRQGIKFGVYYSQCQDWHHPGGFAIKTHNRTAEHWDPAQDGDYDAYLNNVAVPQVRELLSNYGPIAVLWFDTARDMTPDRAERFLSLLSLQPDIIVNDRLGGGFRGDTETPEQHIPPQGYPGRDWETCMTINDTWGYKSYDTDFKSTETLLHNLVDIASKGGNYLLNVGPTSQGVIPEPEVDRLKAIGAWLQINGESIYGTQGTPFGSEAGHFDPEKKDKHGKPVYVTTWDWRCTTKPGKLFIHLLRWPSPTFQLTGVKEKITRAYLLADPQQTNLDVLQNGDHVSVELPPTPPDNLDSVLVLETQD